ncbi:MAG: hypothetical protein F4Y56_06660 [Acidimicrobiaceae bacterium]|nr:hypothetical protein [Acidimicrobiaceae bacterium]MYE57352.1 hypothetical protein [Acidimicrobiaceae bacterium]MYF31795.1 hypothetical protein [Acidimicrobiaceae bacterium]MYJ30650.1 hypothetical protein [Acidimicrobiaceae bacterium]
MSSRSLVGPTSTSRPRYITATLETNWGSRARSWVMNRKVRSSDSWRSCNSSITWAWIDTSRALVGSSQMITFG